MTAVPMDIELLTTDDHGNPIKGVRFPRDLGCVRYEPESPDSLAHRHAFYRLDGAGQPIEGTLVEFYVPSDLLHGGFPTERALRLVQRRMGWAKGGPMTALEPSPTPVDSPS